MNDKNFENYLRNTAEQLEETANGFLGVKNSLYGLMLDTFSKVFEMTDHEDKPIYLSLKKPELEELIDSLDNYMIPIFEEDNNKELLEKCKGYKKLLQERLEK